MLQELIDLAEEIYAKDKNTGIRLGKLIQEVGKELRYMDSRCKEFYDAKVRLENRVKRLEAECLAIKTLH
jgi:hypothetical protein